MTKTLDYLILELGEKVKNNEPISASQWLDYASSMNVMMLDLEDELIKAEMVVNKKISDLMFPSPDSASPLTAAAAKIRVRGMDDYRNYLVLKAKKERAVECIRLGKKRVELQNWDQ